jgi:hypothetical protein
MFCAELIFLNDHIEVSIKKKNLIIGIIMSSYIILDKFKCSYQVK